ncbi:hypothetical protein H7X46_12855 [Pseudonocardia sp. C8]|uniref:hypothetical protein n=1 Tax=Pseudonocardia sp. C8 TaxID=2762759 RepID=UPI0016428419|nr:hypothetical protein [Pseudonocardia sp. C8]MBC3191954.1 hypothetical protein [Pseudonocardia sp. C8]
MPDDPTGDDRERFVVGLLADPDLPTEVALSIAPQLQRTLHGEVAGHPVEWTVVTGQDPFESLGSADSTLHDKARERVRDTGWDVAVCLTDVPVRRQGRTVLADVGNDRVAVVSLPALGALGMHRRARKVITDLVLTMTGRMLSPGYQGTGVPPVPVGGLLRLVTGMVKANRPLAFTTGLARSLAGGLAGSAFGVLYPSIWTLADSMPPWRLVATVCAATVAHTGWLIVAHRLWERRGDLQRQDRPSTGLRNTATVITAVLGVTAYTAILFLLALAALSLIVTPAYLGALLGHVVGPADYLAAAAMATVVGTVAGAIGSGLEDADAVRHAAYGHRTAERMRAGDPEPDSRGAGR